MRIGFCVIVAALLALPTYPSPSAASPVPSQENSRSINGYEVSGRFLEEWSRHGSEQASVYVNGLPITPRRPEISVEDGKTYEMQWFERARFELHPTNKKPYDVLLGRLGTSMVEGRGSTDPATGRLRNPADAPFAGIARPADADGTSKVWFPETRHTLSGKFLEYWHRYGGLKQFGYPLSEPFQEVSQGNGRTYQVQYFERARMELQPGKAAPYEVELGLLGVEQYRMRPVASNDLPVAPPKGVKSAKDQMRIISTQEPANLTIFDNSHANARIRSLIEDGLVARDHNENAFPKIAWYVPTLENGGARFLGTGEDRYVSVKYKLRPGIKWSDGKEATSRDVFFYYKLIMDPDAPVVGRGAYLMLANVLTPDKHTAIFNYRSLRELRAFYNSLPNAEDYKYLRVFIDANKPPISKIYSEIGSIYPEHALSGIRANRITESPFATAPIGTGPFKLVKWEKRWGMTFEQNEHYILTEKPLLKRIEIRFASGSSGGTSIGRQVPSGEFDLITSEAFQAPPDNQAELPSRGLKLASRPAAAWEHIDFYFDYEPFKEKAVREAIITAINRRRIADEAYRGTTIIMNGVVPPSVFHSLEHPDFSRKYPDIAAQYKLPIYRYDPDRAARLLDAAGWKCPATNTAKNCAGGVREKSGEKLSFEYGTTTQVIRQQIQALVAADLRAVGVDAQTKDYSSTIFFAQDATSPQNTGVTKFAQFSWVGSSDSDFSVWTCSSIWDPHTFTGQNSQRYCNPAIDRLNSQYNTDSDPKVWVRASAEAQVTLMEDIVLVPLVARPNIEVVRATLQNHKLSNSQVPSFWNARQWYFR